MRVYFYYECGIIFHLVSFDSTSQGHLAMVIYEWEDAKYLGKVRVSDVGDELPVCLVYAFCLSFKRLLVQRIYVCDGDSLSLGYCTREQLGHFILDIPKGKNINETSFWSALVQLPANGSTTHIAGTHDRRDRFEGNPPWYHEVRSQIFPRATSDSTSDLIYQQPIQYPVKKTGFYCVGQNASAIRRVLSSDALL